jgi:hypothetical protein
MDGNGALMRSSVARKPSRRLRHCGMPRPATHPVRSSVEPPAARRVPGGHLPCEAAATTALLASLLTRRYDEVAVAGWVEKLNRWRASQD